MRGRKKMKKIDKILIMEATLKGWKWVCPYCGKKIESLYKDQARANSIEHLESHKKEMEEE